MPSKRQPKGCDRFMENDQTMRGPGRGRQAGLASLIIPLAGYVIQDLRKPNSTVKALAQRAYAYLTQAKADRRKAIDPAGRVEVIETKTAGPVQELDQNQD